ncbi:B-cell receptor-associated protein 31-like-domain-containing protein [Gongronella butleri]|nr:B-cell receptor-associated protein 31-like-domain-containing protein [Gongronella butleri]
MTIYYTLTFAILVTEMFMFGILVVAKALYGLKIIFGFIFVLFIDTINRLQRLDVEEDNEQRHHDYAFEANQRAKKFYAQRNLYLTGFTLFLSLILERTSALVIQMLKREEELESARKESALVGKDQQRLIDMENDYKKQVNTLKAEIKALKDQERDFDTLKKQASQQAAEYDRLADERNAFERAASGQKDEDKKSI